MRALFEMAEARRYEGWHHFAALMAFTANINRPKGKAAFKDKDFHPMEKSGKGGKTSIPISAGNIKVLKQAFGAK